jgi:hypothetical protein
MNSVLVFPKKKVTYQHGFGAHGTCVTWGLVVVGINTGAIF